MNTPNWSREREATMKTHEFKNILKTAARVLAVLPFAVVAVLGQQTINLTAGPTSLALPDGSPVPMWGYTCGTTAANSTANCAALNPAAKGGWSPIVITVPTGQGLTINLTNNLTFTPGSTSTPNRSPTTRMIYGQ